MIDGLRRLPAAVQPAPSHGITVVTNRPGSQAPGAATVILVDRLNTRFEDQAIAREEIVKCLSQARLDDRVAFYSLDSNEVRVHTTSRATRPRSSGPWQRRTAHVDR